MANRWLSHRANRNIAGNCPANSAGAECFGVGWMTQHSACNSICLYKRSLNSTLKSAIEGQKGIFSAIALFCTWWFGRWTRFHFLCFGRRLIRHTMIQTTDPCASSRRTAATTIAWSRGAREKDGLGKRLSNKSVKELSYGSNQGMLNC